jgi:DNA-binding NarL/FixJ family response regulator
MAKGPGIGIAIVGDDPLARAGLEARLAAAAGLPVVASVGPQELGSGVLAGTGARAVLWDLGPGGAPGPSGAAGVEAIDAALAELARADVAVVLLLAQSGSDEAAARAVRTALQSGVRGLLPREAGGPQLASALAAAASGLVVMDERLLAMVAGPPTGAAAAAGAAGAVEPSSPLSPRELEVLALLADGLSNKRLADRLGISEHTAKFHVNAILEKLGADTRTDAVVKAARLGLLVL